MCQLAAMNVMAMASAITPNAIKVLAFVLTSNLLANRYPQCVLSYLVISSGLVRRIPETEVLISLLDQIV